MNLGPSVVNILEAAMFVVREPVDLFSCCCPQIEDASGMATANSVEVKFGLVCGENSGCGLLGSAISCGSTSA